MTNLLEKTLLLGFSIFLLTVFSTILIPFLNKFNDLNEIKKNELENYRNFLDEINDGVLYVIRNPEELYLKNVEYPSSLNLTFINTHLIGEFLLENNIYSKTYSYNNSFHSSFFYNVPPNSYLLNISYQLSKIFVNFISLF